MDINKLPKFDVTPVNFNLFMLYIKEANSSNWVKIKKEDGDEFLTKEECEIYMTYALSMYKSLYNANTLGSLGDLVTSDFGKVWEMAKQE